MNDQQKLALWVDGSSYLFRAFYALPSLTGPKGQATGAVYGVISMLRGILREQQPDYFAVVFDPAGKNFRHRLYPDYKSHRPPLPDELREQIEPTFNLIKALGYPLLQISDCEADDVIATLSKQAAQSQVRVLIATGDKDMMQLVDEQVHLLDTMKKGGGQHIDAAAVKKKFNVMPHQLVDYLALCGDKSDNIPGVRTVGPKTASDWLNRYHTLEQLLAHVDELKGRSVEHLRSAVDDLPLYRQLVTVRQDIAIEKSFADLRCSPANHDALHTLYHELGFVSWLNELPSRAAVAAKPDREQQAYELILTEQSLQNWSARLRSAGRFHFSLSVDSSDSMTANMIGLAFALPEQTAYIPVAHQRPRHGLLGCREVLQCIKPLLTDAKVAKLGWGMKFIRNVLLRHNIELTGISDDLMLASYVHNATACQHDLRSLAACYLASKDATPAKADDKKPTAAAARAVCTTGRMLADGMGLHHQLERVFKQKLKPQSQPRRWYEEVELPLLTVLSDMEHRGVMVDTAALAKQSVRLQEKITSLQEDIDKRAGRAVNIDSPQQVAQLLFVEHGLPPQRKTSTGHYSTAEDVLEVLALEFELPRLILDCRACKKLKSSFVDKLIKMVSPHTRRVHTCYQQALTATGRLSSSNPNLQNIPIRSREGHRIREAFVAAPGHGLLSADYSQIELRIMAHLSGDQNMLSAFSNKEDIHRTTAAEIFRVAEEQVDWQQRRCAKAINFGLIYGMSAYGLAKQLGIARGEAQAYVDAYFAHYPQIKNYMQAVQEQARERGYVETLFGRRLYTPDIRSRQAGRRQHAERAAINAPMQGTAADIIKRAMVDLHAFLKRSGSAAMLMQVHDELVFEVPRAMLDTFARECRKRMVAAADLSIPLAVDIKSGPHWGLTAMPEGEA